MIPEQPTTERQAPGVGDRLRRAGRLAVDLILPPHCLACGELVAQPGALCPSCWPRVRFLEPPACDACGLPFDFAIGDGALCGGCLHDRPEYDRARAALVYDAGSRPLVLGFKHGDRTEAAPAFAAWIARSAPDLVADADVIVPVPLHWTRLFARLYNQAALVALALGRRSGVAVAPDLLIRRRRTPSQGRLSAGARRRNVRGAFAVRPGVATVVKDARVLLVDDVYTTGATVRACARTLRRAGARAVDVLTVARVVGPAPSA